MRSKQTHLDRLGSSLRVLLTTILVGVICGYAPPVVNRAEASAEPGTATAETSLPAGVSSDWWSTVQEDIRLSEYDVTWQEQTPRMVSVDLPAAYQAPNRVQNLRTYFTEQGIWVIPRVFEGDIPPWEWGLALTGYGYEDGMQPVGAANLSSHDNRIEYRRNDPLTGSEQVLTEWYVNDEPGLEQGFTLHAPPQSIIENSQSKIVLDIALHGNLTAVLDHAGQTIEFTTSDGVRVLRYADLTVFDGAARQLPAHFSLLPNGAEGDMGGIRITFDGTAARYPITVDPLATSPAWTAESNQDSAYFGASVGTAGDVNGDGYSDVIIGTPLYDNGQTNEGRAYVYHGSAGGLAITPAWTTESNQADARFGWSVGTAGDVHDDGYSDVIIGAYLYDSGATDTGSAYLYRGSAVGLVASSSWTAGSGQANAQFGYSVSAAGDVNGDGYSDVIVGAPEYNGNGRVYVYHGMAAGLTGPVMAFDFSGSFGHSVGTAGDVNGDGYSDVIVGAPYYDNGQTDEGLAAVLRGSPGGVIPAITWVVNGNQNGANLGYSVAAAGDVNGDGYSDVIVGMPYYDNGQEDEGLANIYNGSAAGLATTANWTAEGNQTSAAFGHSVATAGDMNGDSYSDVIVGAPLYDDYYADVGLVVGYYGGASGMAATAAWTAEVNEPNANCGWSVGTAGDVNGDGYSDVIVGAPYFDNGQTDEGLALVFHGSAAGLAATVGWTAESNWAEAAFGISVGTAGDVNGDGYSDVIVGAHRYGSLLEGRAFVFHGSAAGPTAEAAWTADGQWTTYLGKSVSTAGDVNGDGYSDVIVGAYQYDNGQTDEGRALVFYGSATGLATAAAWTAESDQAYAYFGDPVGTAGDVNGDGYSDVIVGAPYYDNGESNEGRTYVYHGSATGLVTTAAWTAESNRTSAYYGKSVGTAGDVNDDGYADVIIGATGYTNGQTAEGCAYVYDGSATGLAATSAWTAESDQAHAWFGTSVGTAGDVNGDGYSDVIVGAIGYDNDQTDEGRTFVYHGSPVGLAATPAWTAESDQINPWFGISVGTAGDVNGDGYSDIIVGANYFDNGQGDEGAAFLYHGSAVGLATTYAWTAESNQDYAYFGYSVSTAGDVNGDGYSDVVIGAYLYDNSLNNEGRAFVYYGNNGDGLDLVPQQRRADGSVPLAPGGQSISPTQVRLAALGRSPYGRGDVRLQWEVKPQGTSFNGSGLGQGTWQDSGAVGYALNELVSGLTFETRYHWRVRLQYHPTTTPYQPYSRWLYGGPFFTALSGDQAIASTGLTNLLGQTASVNVTNLGSPGLTTLTLRGYPNTAPPNASSFPGYGSGTSILDRYFSIATNSGASGYTLTLCLNYEDSEVTAAGATEAGLRLCRWTGSAWACPERSASSNVNSNLVCADGVTEFSNWAMASSPSTCSEWDVNCDGQVNVVDVQLVAGAWNNPPAYQSAYDHDNNGTIDIIDVELQAINWGGAGVLP